MKTVNLDILQIVENEDGTCDIKFEMDEDTKYALVQYALKHIIIEAATKTIKENTTTTDSENGNPQLLVD